MQPIVDTIISIASFLLLLTFLITIHELGHFIVAMLCKVGVLEFGFGIPPKVRTLFTWRGVPFTLNALPFGGFVRMLGEDGSTEEVQGFQKNKGVYYHFGKIPLWQKILIVLAGPTVNILFGVIVFSSLYSLYGIPETTPIPPTVTLIAENSPASSAGLQKNDEIERIDDKNIKTASDIITYVNDHRGQTLRFTIKRDGTQVTTPVYARKADEIPQGEGTIGVALSDMTITPKFYPGLEQIYRGTKFGIERSFEFSGTILRSLGDLGKSLVAGKVPSEVSGPVGIANEVQKQKILSAGWATAFNFAALLSINLGVMNLLPIPALDGGRIVLLIIEKFVKHKRFESISQTANQFGFFLLIGLLILITIKDIFGILR